MPPPARPPAKTAVLGASLHAVGAATGLSCPMHRVTTGNGLPGHQQAQHLRPVRAQNAKLPKAGKKAQALQEVR